MSIASSLHGHRASQIMEAVGNPGQECEQVPSAESESGYPVSLESSSTNLKTRNGLFRTMKGCEPLTGLSFLLTETENPDGPPGPIVRSQKVAQLSNAADMYSLATSLQVGSGGSPGGLRTAEALYRQAINLGHAAAANDLAVLKERGCDEFQRDIKEAMELYKIAATRGNVVAMNNLGRLYFLGAGVTQSMKEAYDIYLQAAKCDSSDAMNNVAMLIQMGDPEISGNAAEAYEWYQKAAKLENSTAIYNLGVMYRDGTGVEEDLKEAEKQFRKASERGDVNAMCALAILLEHGSGTRRNIPEAIFLLKRAERKDPSHCLVKTTLARLLLSEEAGSSREPREAAELLTKSLQLDPNFGYALHELAVLYALGDDGVSVETEEAKRLFSLAASQSRFENVQIYQSERLVIDAGEFYPGVIREILRVSFVKPKTCLLLTLGGGCRGKTSTVNSLRGMPFVETHIPTEMAAMNKFVLEPGVRGRDEDIILECDFNENSLRAIASRLHKKIVTQSEMKERMQDRNLANSTSHSAPVGNTSYEESIFTTKGDRHSDVIERIRRSLMLAGIPPGFKGSVVQVWDMAGQSRYEMAHSLVISRGGILLFVTDLTRVAQEETREDEVGVLCYWMQLAHFLVPDPSRVRILIVGTRKKQCDHEKTLGILKTRLAYQLANKVFDAWIRVRHDVSMVGSASKFIAIENSLSSTDPTSSGLDELEKAVQAAGDEVAGARDPIPLRWLALVDKLERETQNSARLHFRRTDILTIANGFPGFSEDALERENDILEGLRCYASMGRLVLFEPDEQEWYVCIDVHMITNVLGKLTAPEERLRDLLSSQDINGLAEGRISQAALFSLWGDYSEEDKRLMLRILCRFDLLLLLTGNENTIVEGDVTVGIPAMMKSGWEDFRWGRLAGERDLKVETVFEEGIPSGLIGFLISHIHRTHVVEEEKNNTLASASLKVRADSFLIRARDGSRVFLGFKGTERKLIWKFRGRNPIHLVYTFIGDLEKLEINRSFVMSKPHKHTISLDCDSLRGGCGTPRAVQIELRKQWFVEGNGSSLPPPEWPCKNCVTLMPIEEVFQSLWPPTAEIAPASTREHRVMPPGKYDVFISHAGPDKLALAHPLFESLTWRHVRAFLDMEDLQILNATAAEEMVRAMEEARVGVFILSPEFAARDWPMRELRRFLERDEECKAARSARPVLLPIFYKLSLEDCSQCDKRIYATDSPHYDMLVEEKFFTKNRQKRCSTADAIEALKKLRTYAGVLTCRVGGGEDLSSAGVMIAAVRRVVDYMHKHGLLPPRPP